MDYSRSQRRLVRRSADCFCQLRPRQRSWRSRWRESVASWASGGPESPACWIPTGETAFAWTVLWLRPRRIETGTAAYNVRQLRSKPRWRCACFRPALPLQVRLAEGRPAHLEAARNQRRVETELQGKILWSAGPWHSSGDWWTENAKEESASQDRACPWDREEWDVALARGKRRHCSALLHLSRSQRTDIGSQMPATTEERP